MSFTIGFAIGMGVGALIMLIVLAAASARFDWNEERGND